MKKISGKIYLQDFKLFYDKELFSENDLKTFVNKNLHEIE